MMKKFWKIMKSEYRRFFHDGGSVLIMVIGVIAYSIFYSIPYSHEVLQEVPVAVVDMDNTELSREFTQRLDANDNVEVVRKTTDKNEAQHLFYSSKLKGYIVIPKDFEKDIKNGNQTHVSMYADSSYLIIYKAVATGTTQTAVSLGGAIEVNSLMKQGVPKQMAMNLKQPFEFVSTPLYNPAGGYATYIYPVILILILHQTIVVGLGLLLGTMKEKHRDFCYHKQNRGFVLFARSTAYVLLYMFYSLFYYLLYPAIVNYPMSYNLLPLFIFLVPFYYATVFFAHFLSILYTTRESSLLIFVVSSLILIFLPGFIWPKEAIPMYLNVISFFIPATKGVDGIIKLNQMNATFYQIFGDFCVIVFLAVLYYFLALKFACKCKSDRS